MSFKSVGGFYLFLNRKGFAGVLAALLLILVVAEGIRPTSHTSKEIDGQLNRLNNPAVKTIMSEDGDIIDCVDIYKQPAFAHPLLRNHTIEMRPRFIPNEVKGNNSFRFLAQAWQKNGSCPEGTIPVQRPRETDFARLNDSKYLGLNDKYSNCKVEVARIELHNGGPYIGAQGTINVWNLNVEANEWSLNSVTVFNDVDSFMEAGWAVSPDLFGDSKPRLFVNWMDTSKGNGCFNLRCAGFVQVSNGIVLGGALPYVSVYDREQFNVNFVTYKDAVQGKWWMVFQGEPIGYWPLSLFQGFDGAPRVNWGGSVCNTEANGYHTTTQMGSGHFPREGYRRASYVRNALVMKPDKSFVPARPIQLSPSYQGCYDVLGTAGPFPGDKGPCVYYGGPGGKCCDARC